MTFFLLANTVSSIPVIESDETASQHPWQNTE